MNCSDTEMCPDCGQRAIGGLIFHELFCYDVYLVSVPPPLNKKQTEIDEYMTEKIVKQLESKGIKCYHGSRDICGGEHVIAALSKPITIIPTTIMPVYKDRIFSDFRNLLLRVDYLDRIVFLMFDSTPVQPPAVSKNSFSITINDPHLLQKLMKTITTKTEQIPLDVRKRKYAMSDPESTISISSFEFQRNIPFRRSDRSRISFRVKSVAASTAFEDGNMYSITISPHELLSFCHSPSVIIRQDAAKILARRIQKDIAMFSKIDNLEDVEKQIRYLRQKHNTMDIEKLYFWISTAIFYRIYKWNDLSLKMHMKMLTLSKYKTSKDRFEQLCQETYHRLTSSLHAKMKMWPNRLDTNVQYVKKIEDCLSLIDPKLSEKVSTPPDALTKILSSLPGDMKHIVIVTIAEKLFQKKYTNSSVSFFFQICNIIGKKHWAVFIDVLERVKEYMLDTYTKELLLACLQILKYIVTWKSERRRKDDKLSFILKQMIRNLVYHPVDEVRNYVSLLAFQKDSKGFISGDISHLGNHYLKVSEDLVEECFREHLLHSYRALTIHDQVPMHSAHTLMFEAKTTEGDSLLYVLRQKTLNDVLNTNFTDATYESFQEMLRSINMCQGQDNIVALRNTPSNGVLPFFVVEHGQSLLSFLHEKENQLSWIQMIDILIDITKAIHHCHNNNVILRDITPASFIIVPRENGSLQTKLASFLYAKCLHDEEPNNEAEQYIDDISFLCVQGDRTEVIAAYFSAPESLLNKTFSKYSEAWMLAATFLSILLYGKCPFQELAHLNVFKFVKECKWMKKMQPSNNPDGPLENLPIRTLKIVRKFPAYTFLQSLIIAGHIANIPRFLPKDLSEILSTNLNVTVQERMMTETLLDKLETCKSELGRRMDTVPADRTACCYISSEDILRGYVDKGEFVKEHTEDPEEGTCKDDATMVNGELHETVSFRMSLNTRRKLQQLIHNNIVTVDEIKSGIYNTILISKAFDGHMCQLREVDPGIDIDQLFFYFEQITLALLELHNNNIVHCDLRCDHIYVNQEKGTLKVSHFGRAVSLEGRQTYAFKMVPPDAKKWSAPEVRANRMYSKASDVFSLAAVFWEAMSTQEDKIYSNYPLELFYQCQKYMEEYAEINIPDNWEDSINKLIKFMQKCWNPNQAKRPILDEILDMIQQIRISNAQYWSADEEHDSEYRREEEATPEYVYETIIESPVFDFSFNYAWRKVVNELASSHETPESNTTNFIEHIETCSYEDVGLSISRTKRTPKPSNLL